MAAQVVKRLPEGDDWIYELKFGGYRALIIKDKKQVELRSRKNKNLFMPCAASPPRREPFRGVCLSSSQDVFNDDIHTLANRIEHDPSLPPLELPHHLRHLVLVRHVAYAVVRPLP